ncbi:hypothetical protein CNEO4_1700022 [Clostridium neonatale]|nr:hypothetical protein CNEO4_1700022 [Clostridium neonatale]
MCIQSYIKHIYVFYIALFFIQQKCVLNADKYTYLQNNKHGKEMNT